MELGKRIAEIRKENSLTQEGLAEICNVTRQTISNWENSKSYPDLETLVLISDIFDVSLDAMLKGDRKMVSEITKEQTQGRLSKTRIIVAILIATVVITAFFITLNNTSTNIEPKDYRVTVKEITLDDVIINTDEKTAKYTWSDSEQMNTYLFSNEEYYFLITYGHVYDITIESDKWFDNLVVSDSDEPVSLIVSVSQSNRSKLDGHKKGNRMGQIWFTEFNSIYDADTYEKGDKEAALVWQK